jgi:hypothetical protein
MMYLFVVLLAFVSSAQAQTFDRSDGCCRWQRQGEWRYRKDVESWRRHNVRRHHRHRRFEAKEEERGPRIREAQGGYPAWRAPEKDEAYRGWWRPEDGWRESDRDRRCRPPMHAAGAADARQEAAKKAAIKAWQEQVINEHGERFMTFDVAYIIDQHCDPARVGEGAIIELKRCVVTAAPCLKPKEGDQRGDEERQQAPQ